MADRDLQTAIEELALSGKIGIAGNRSLTAAPATTRAWAKDLNQKLQAENYDWRVACDPKTGEIWQISVGEHDAVAETGRPRKKPGNGLRNCPFCQGKAKRIGRVYSGKLLTDPTTGAYSHEQLRWYAVKCSACGVSQPKRRYDTREESDAAWNARPD